MGFSKKSRIDVLLVERGLAQSRERAQALILAGNVIVNDTPMLKAGTSVDDCAEIRIRGAADHPWVSRGGVKLARALETFKIPVAGRTALDVGASTGGFTDVLLTQGAECVFTVDVGHSQLDWKIRSNPRVKNFERINVRSLTRSHLPDAPAAFDLIVIDVSFISLDKILPPLIPFCEQSTDWVVLIKPQFEVGRDGVGKGGIVTSPDARKQAVERICDVGESLGLATRGLIESPITGTDGNIEYLAHFKKT